MRRADRLMSPRVARVTARLALRARTWSGMEPVPDQGAVTNNPGITRPGQGGQGGRGRATAYGEACATCPSDRVHGSTFTPDHPDYPDRADTERMRFRQGRLPGLDQGPEQGSWNADSCSICGGPIDWSRPGAIVRGDGVGEHLACYEADSRPGMSRESVP